MPIILPIVLGIIAAGMSGCGLGPHRVICLGDSLTVCGGPGGRYSDWLAEYLPEEVFINKGVNGDTLADGRARFAHDVLALNGDVLIIALGANDYWRQNRSIDALEDDLAWMIAEAQSADMEVVIASCFSPAPTDPPDPNDHRAPYAAAIAHMEQRVSRRYDCPYVPDMQRDIKPNGRPPYWSDHNHPSKEGNEKVAQRILPALQKALRRKRPVRIGITFSGGMDF